MSKLDIIITHINNHGLNGIDQSQNKADLKALILELVGEDAPATGPAWDDPELKAERRIKAELRQKIEEL